jgi:hypothetical protein
LKIDSRRRLGVRVAQSLRRSDQLREVFRVVCEMLLIAFVVNRFESLFLQNELSVDYVTDSPHPFAMLAVSLALAGEPLLETACSTDSLLDDFPGHIL